jgi:tRNA A-37 threonylcarbamoyl transferase component Bud32
VAIVAETDPIPEVPAPAGWTLGALIARGGTAFVHTVKHDTGTVAILKRGRWRDRDVVARFAHEARVLQALGAPLAPALFDHGAVDGWPHLVVELVPGEPLSAWMSRHADRGGLGQIVAVLGRAADALAQLHDRRLVHRDVKPENLLVGPAGVRLIDFGLATEVGAAASANAAGTLHYMAPELLGGGGAADPRSDVYALGVVAFEMVAGIPPFTGERRAIEYNHRASPPPALREFRDVPAALDDLVAACLAKSIDARPRDARAVRAELARVFETIATLRGVGGRDRAVGRTDLVALAWIEGGDPVAVARAVTDVGGVVIRRHGDGVVAGFPAALHDAPVADALALCGELAARHGRIAVHAASLLVRRTPQGKLAIYGDDVDHVDGWLPAMPFRGLVVTAAAAAHAPAGLVVPAPDLPKLFRPRAAAVAEPPRETPLVGRDRLIAAVVNAAGAPGQLVWLAGGAALGKTRVLAAVAARLRDAGREVVAIAGRRRFVGEAPDDDRVVAALGGGADVAEALAAAGARGAVVILDDAHWLSPAVRRAVVARGRGATCIAASPEPAVEPSDAAAIAVYALAPLSIDDAGALVRALLQPARRIPDAFVERLVARGDGAPGALVALVRDLVERGAVRRDVAGTDWYVAADEVTDAPAGAHALRRIPDDHLGIAQVAAALGPRFGADELAAAAGVAGAAALAALVDSGVLVARAGWYEFVDPRVQDALVAAAGAAAAGTHDRALAYWLGHRLANVAGWIARVAFHAAGAGRREVAAGCWLALARLGHARHDAEATATLLDAALGQLAAAMPAELAPMMAELRDVTPQRG